MRISSGLFLCGISLASCAPESGVPDGEPVACALDGSTDFASDCILEAFSDGEFTIHHPDGGFRRFRYDRGTSELIAKDGAAGVVSSHGAEQDLIQFTVETDRYRVDLENLANISP
jgi:hypothetical protein